MVTTSDFQSGRPCSSPSRVIMRLDFCTGLIRVFIPGSSHYQSRWTWRLIEQVTSRKCVCYSALITILSPTSIIGWTLTEYSDSLRRLVTARFGNQRWGLESLDSDTRWSRVPILLDLDLDLDSSPTHLNSDSNSDSTRTSGLGPDSANCTAEDSI